MHPAHPEYRLVELYDAANAIHWRGALPPARPWSEYAGDRTSPGAILRAYQERAPIMQKCQAQKITTTVGCDAGPLVQNATDPIVISPLTSSARSGGQAAPARRSCTR